ncbi:unnamed protein product, partial [Closterium sp. NIES-54]
IPPSLGTVPRGNNYPDRLYYRSSPPFPPHTHTGSRTLGEEYCDIMQVSGGYNLPPTPARRLSLVLLHCLLPAVAAHISARAAARGRALAAAEERGEAASEGRAVEGAARERGTRDGGAVGSGAVGSGAVGRGTGGTTGSPSGREGGAIERGGVAAASVSGGRGLGWVAAVAAGRYWVGRARERVRERVREMGRRALVVWAGVAARGGDVLMLLGRAHLLLFYWHGSYLHVAKRVTGVRYIYTAQPPAYSPRFVLLAFWNRNSDEFSSSSNSTCSHATPCPSLATPCPSPATPRPSHAIPRPSHATPRPSHATPCPSLATPRPSHVPIRTTCSPSSSSSSSPFSPLIGCAAPCCNTGPWRIPYHCQPQPHRQLPMLHLSPARGGARRPRRLERLKRVTRRERQGVRQVVGAPCALRLAPTPPAAPAVTSSAGMPFALFLFFHLPILFSTLPSTTAPAVPVATSSAGMPVALLPTHPACCPNGHPSLLLVQRMLIIVSSSSSLSFSLSSSLTSFPLLPGALAQGKKNERGVYKAEHGSRGEASGAADDADCGGCGGDGTADCTAGAAAGDDELAAAAEGSEGPLDGFAAAVGREALRRTYLYRFHSACSLHHASSPPPPLASFSPPPPLLPPSAPPAPPAPSPPVSASPFSRASPAPATSALRLPSPSIWRRMSRRTMWWKR